MGTCNNSLFSPFQPLFVYLKTTDLVSTRSFLLTKQSQLWFLVGQVSTPLITLFFTPNHSALPLPDANISWNANCRGSTTLQLRPHSCQIEQKDYVMYLTEIISACTSPNSIWLFCKSVTSVIVLISEILSYLILHHCSFSPELLICQLFPEVILGVSDWMCKLLNSFGIFTLPSGLASFQWLDIFCLNK